MIVMATASETTLVTTHNESGTKWWTRFLDPSERTLGVLRLMPAALLLTLIIVYPVCRLIWTSFQNLSLTSGVPATFAGLENYSLMLEDPVFWETTWNTVLITLITVPGALLVGLALALMANLPFNVKWPVRLSCRSPSQA
jgi:multiple sugar transport system permease protein